MKIPSHAMRVFKGIIYDVYQWEQELFDGSKKTFEALKRPNTIVVIPVIDGQIIYAQQEQPGKPPFLSLLGGGAHENEEPLDTAKRELLEEAGLVSDDWHLLRQYAAPSKIEWHIYYFVARACRKVAGQTLDAGEKIDLRTASVEDFFNKIVPQKTFMEWELQQEIMSGFNDAIANEFKKEILGDQ